MQSFMMWSDQALTGLKGSKQIGLAPRIACAVIGGMN
jgi:hypothetical protein